MIPVFAVSALMWLLLGSLLVLRRGRGERSITWAALTIAIAMTLNIDSIYRLLDRLAGGSNAVTLVADLALMVGIFFLGRGVMKASELHSRVVRLALSRPTLAAALCLSTVSFLFIDRGSTTTTFMLDLGEQPAAATYSVIHFSYYAIVVGAMAILAIRQLQISRGAQLWPLVFLLAGSVFGVLLSGAVVTMDIAHVTGNLNLMSSVAVAYGPLDLLTFLFLCAGLGGQPVARALDARSRARQTRALVNALDPIWEVATSVRPGISQREDAEFRGGDPETVLHRQVVEIRDAMIDTRTSFEIGDRDGALLERAERHLLGMGRLDDAGESAKRPIVQRRQKAS